MNEVDQQGPDSGRVGFQPCPIRRAIALMEANFAAKLSREEMARAAGLSVSYFSKLFTQCIGLSPHQYLVRCRLRHGKKLLAKPEEKSAALRRGGQSRFCRSGAFLPAFPACLRREPLAFRRTARRRI